MESPRNPHCIPDLQLVLPNLRTSALDGFALPGPSGNWSEVFGRGFAPRETLVRRTQRSIHAFSQRSRSLHLLKLSQATRFSCILCIVSLCRLIIFLFNSPQRVCIPRRLGTEARLKAEIRAQRHNLRQIARQGRQIYSSSEGPRRSPPQKRRA